jgi:ATP/ADP translocase
MAASARGHPILSWLNLDQGMAACWWRTLFPSLSLFLLTAAFIVTKTGRDALYFQNGGVADLPKAYLAIALLAPLPAAATLGMMRSFGSRSARVIALLGMAVVQVCLSAGVRPGGGWSMTLVFVSIPLLYGVLLSLAWLLGADLLDMAPRYVLARLYATMGAASMIGGLCGAALSRRLATQLDPAWFFFIGTLGLLSAAMVNVAAHRTFPIIATTPDNPGPVPAPANGDGPKASELAALLRVRYLTLLAAIGMIASLVGVLIEFQFYLSASASAVSASQALRIYADFYFWVNLAAVSVQLFATPSLQRWLGVHGSLLVLPSALVGASAVVSATASVAASTGLRVTEGGLKSSVHRSNWEQAYLPLNRPVRATAKILVDGLSARLGEGTAAVILVAGAWSAPSRTGETLLTGWLSQLLVAGSLVWLALTLLLRRTRDDEGLLRLDHEEFRADLPIPDG